MLRKRSASNAGIAEGQDDEIAARDRIDSSRPNAPLTIAQRRARYRHAPTLRSIGWSMRSSAI